MIPKKPRFDADGHFLCRGQRFQLAGKCFQRVGAVWIFLSVHHVLVARSTVINYPVGT